MSALTVWKFETVEGAGAALSKLESLSKQELITIEDAAVVYWEPGKKKPKTHQAHSLTGVGALGGAFWGMLFGLLFFMPFFGMAVGAAIGALAEKPELLGRTLILVGLAEGIAIYGLIIAILILNRIG